MSVTTVRAIIADFCINYCKYAKECNERMENVEELRKCPLDRL